MNSDWETLRRFALHRFPAGYAERCALMNKSMYRIFAIFLLFTIPIGTTSCSLKEPVGVSELLKFDTKKLGSKNMEIIIEELSYVDNISIVRERVMKRGSYAGAIMFQVCTLSSIAKKRGFKYFVVLDSKNIENCEGCEWSSEIVLGFLNNKDLDLKEQFPKYYKQENDNTIEDVNEYSPVCNQVESICSW